MTVTYDLTKQKKCNRCLTIKPVEEFPKAKKAIGGYNTVCKICTRNTQQAHEDYILVQRYTKFLTDRGYKVTI